MKKYLSIIVILVIVVLVIAWVRKAPEQPVIPTPSTSNPTGRTMYPLNLTYEVDDENVQFVDGKAEVDRASFQTFGNPIFGDIGMGTESSAVFLVKSTTGTGVFYFVGAGYEDEGEFKGSNAVFVGDRIMPQELKIVNGVLEVYYLTRKDGEPMAAEPTVKAVKYLVLKDGVLTEKK